ncbi:MAG TPA: glucosaminidase domain-containing protein [Puia sp.]|nr:glucosaminidase domain-containing protein [Puia sp.]
MKVKIVIVSLLVLAAGSLRAQGPYSADVISYINTYKALSMAEMQRSGIPASIILAQGIHETEAGNSELVKKANNHFGIKCKDEWKGATIYHDDDSRGECFRSYPTAEDSYRDHSEFLRGSARYAFLFKLDPTDYEGWAYGLRKAGYATNIRYSQILIKLIKDYNLAQYTLIAMGKLSPSDEVVLGGGGHKPDTAGTIQPAANYPSGQSAMNYPSGEFQINKTRVIYAKAGISLLSVADQYELALSRLLEFNDMKEEDILDRDQLLFLQRKRKTGATEFHVVREGESLYDISQAEGVRYQDLLEMNQGTSGAQPAVGQKVYLQASGSRVRSVTDGRSTN